MGGKGNGKHDTVDGVYTRTQATRHTLTYLVPRQPHVGAVAVVVGVRQEEGDAG